ncbi:MAG: transposase, partial [Planctomycetota bacterium]
RHGGDSRRFDPLDFIAQIVLHIPDVHEKTVIYYGWYSNRTRARRAKQDQAGAPATHAPAGEPKLPLAVRRAWAAMIKRVYEVAPLICPHCKATMRIVSYIEDEDVIYRILKHLDLLGKDSPVGEVRVRGAPEPPAPSA